MKVCSLITTCAAIGGTASLISAVPAEALSISMEKCISLAGKSVSVTETRSRGAWHEYKTEAQTICHYAIQAKGSDIQKIEVGIEKAGYKGRLAAIDVLNDHARHTFTRPEPKPEQQRSASRPQTEYEAMMERVNSGAPTPGRSTSSPAPRSTSRHTITASSRCPAGTSYHKIKSGGLLFKRTVAEGCYSDFQASQLRMQANSNQRQRQRDFQRDIQEATRGPVNCSGTVNSWGNGNATYNTNCY
jgi:hypothetical protein